MEPIQISQTTMRRFILGRQGLWPGRRWRGKSGAAAAINYCEALQLDPLAAAARSQDIVLHSRVLDYKPDYLYQLAYKERRFFDYGEWLAMYPMSELPYFRHQIAKKVRHEYVKYFVPEHAKLLRHVRAELRKRGPLGNRHFEGKRLEFRNYRGGKETSLALFDLWQAGELMIHHREGFARVYDFRENIAPKEYDYVAGAKETEEFFARKAISFMGLKREGNILSEMHGYLRDFFSVTDLNRLLKKWKEAGLYRRVRVEGLRDTFLMLAQDLPTLEAIADDRVPKGWAPKETTTLDEVTLLAPLDIVSARGRARTFFDFEYKWEVYTPLAQRRWGYYVLPVLYGDRLAARLDPKLDKSTQTLQIKGFMLEGHAPAREPTFAAALARGLVRFANYLEARRIDLAGMPNSVLKRGVVSCMKRESDLKIA